MSPRRRISDVGDKIIARANENGEDFRSPAQRFTECMQEGCRALGVLAPEAEPRATHYLGQIAAMVERLLATGAACRGTNGDVYFEVSAFPAYGALLDRRVEDLRSGDRVEVSPACASACARRSRMPNLWINAREGFVRCKAMHGL